MAALLPLAVLVGILALTSLSLLLRGGNRYSWLEFQTKARKAEFSLSEAGKLRRTADLAGLEDPTNLFWSARDLDKVIAFLNLGSGPQASGLPERSREGARFMEKIYALRKRLEFEQPRYQSGLGSSREIDRGQRVRLLVHGLGVFDATVIDNNGRFLVLSYPVGLHSSSKYVWKGKRVSLYFWRREDAGYVFDSFVLDDLRVRDVPVIHIAHSDSLLRSQKRKSIRVQASLPAYLYLLKRIEGAFEKAELEPGLRSRILDLSEEGLSLVIGGKAKPGLLVKIQFALGPRRIVMSGTVRSVDHSADKNRSVLHIEAVPPSPRTRNALRSYVYASRSIAEEGLTEAPGPAKGVS